MLTRIIVKTNQTVKEIPDNLHNGQKRSMVLIQNSILFRAFQVRNNLLLSTQQSQSFLEFKTNIRTLRNMECLCK